MKRTLSLHVERLADLTPGELSLVAGGALTLDGCWTGQYRTLPVGDCIRPVTTVIWLPPPTE